MCDFRIETKLNDIPGAFFFADIWVNFDYFFNLETF